MSRFQSFHTTATRPLTPAIQAPESILIDFLKVLSRRGPEGPLDEDLIDWHAAADDPIYLSIFSQQNMLPPADVPRPADLLSPNDPRAAPDGIPPGGSAGRPGHDQLRVCPLTFSWMSATGRTFHADVPPKVLTEKDLITFWADRQITTRYVVATGPIPLEDAR
jgi:hypothetical protein